MWGREQCTESTDESDEISQRKAIEKGLDSLNKGIRKAQFK